MEGPTLLCLSDLPVPVRPPLCSSDH